MKPDEQAYPTIDEAHYEPGLTKREYFAAMAMQGICAYHGSMGLDEEHVKRNALFSVLQADCLIKQLNEDG